MALEQRNHLLVCLILAAALQLDVEILFARSLSTARPLAGFAEDVAQASVRQAALPPQSGLCHFAKPDLTSHFFQSQNSHACLSLCRQEQQGVSIATYVWGSGLGEANKRQRCKSTHDCLRRPHSSFEPLSIQLKRAAVLQRMAAERVLSELQKNPEAWTRVDAILEKSHSQQAKFFALSVCPAVAANHC